MRSRELFKSGTCRDAGGKGLRIRRAFPVCGMKAEKAQNAQIIFGNSRLRRADEAHAPRGNISKAADIIENGAVARCRKRVNGEVAPFGIAPPVSPEHHFGVAPERLDVLAQRGDFEWVTICHHGHGAMLDSRGHRLEARPLHARYHFIRNSRGRDVHIASRFAEQAVADGSSHDPCLFTPTVKRGKNVSQRRLVQPARLKAPCSHFVVPGTNVPFSVWAGT